MTVYKFRLYQVLQTFHRAPIWVSIGVATKVSERVPISGLLYGVYSKGY